MAPGWWQRREPDLAGHRYMGDQSLDHSLSCLCPGVRHIERRGAMRSGTLAIIGLLLASTAMPSSAEARPLLFKMIGALTSPLRAVLGSGPAVGHRPAYRHRSWASHASRRRPAAVAAAPAAAAVGAAAATAATANPDTTPSTTGAASVGAEPVVE